MTQEYSDEITFNLISSKQNYVGDFSSRKRTDVFYRAISVNGARYAEKTGRISFACCYLFDSITFFVNNLFCSSVSAQTLQSEPIVKEIMEYIRTHLQEEISLTSLSDALSLSKYHLCHIFKEQTGTTIYNHFITTFKILTGFTPKKYASLFSLKM